MAEILGAIVNAVSCICNTSTCNCIDQHRNFNDDVDDLRRELESLTSRKQDIDKKLEEAADSGQMATQVVNNWLKQVAEINDNVRSLLERAQRVKWYKRAWLGRLVCRKIIVVQKMNERGNFSEGLVMKKGPVRGKMLSTERLVGETSTKGKIWEYLMGDEVGMIGVCGMGGVGKSTIMKRVYDDLQRETRFHKVIWVTLSYPFNAFELQTKIARAMGETLSEEEGTRADALGKIMRTVRYVLILDDVWENFSLNDVGIPEPTVQNGCKVILTSRSAEVCSFLGCKIVKVQPLSQEESLTLFLNEVGPDVLKIFGLKKILKLIVKECAGLPLAIVVIARSMKGEEDIKVWKNALTELQDCVKSVKGSDDKIFVQLRFSFDRLANEEIKNCFLYCSLFHDDYEFERKDLIEGWIDEGLIGRFKSREEAYNRGHAFLCMLEKNCLLEKCISLYFNRAKMHDVVRDMAVKSIGPGLGYMVKTGMKLTEVPNEHEWAIDLNKVSLMANEISKIPVGLTPKCPTLSTLILSNNPLTEIPESFFEDMSGLKVLDLSHTDIESLPDSISNLEYLSALRLSGCKRLKCLPSLEKLGALKKLDLKGAGIEVVPQGMEKLECLEYLDLCCRPRGKIPTGILSKLSSLQYLVTTDYPGHFRVEELARLRKLEILECGFDDMQDFNYFLSEFNFQSLTTYKLKVGPGGFGIDAFNPEGKFSLKFFGCDIGQECIVLPDRLQHLSFDYCRNMRSSLNKTALIENATELSLCVINGCEELETVVELDSSSSSLCSPVLDKLEELFLWDLPRLCVLVRVEGGSMPPGVFFNLKYLEVESCSGMRTLLPVELLRALQNLEMIRVCSCEQMEEIIASSDSDASLDKFTFTSPKLRHLTLSNLPQLKSICSAKGVMVCDSIEEIRLIKCPELKRIPVQLPLLGNGQPSPPPRLRQIYIGIESKEWWESVEWDHPNAKNLLQPFVEYWWLRY